MNMAVHFSSEKDTWETPQKLFDELNEEFGFTVDVCALPSSAKCAEYYTPEIDGLAQTWRGTCWMNPPYGRQIGKWVEKAALSARAGLADVVCLVPARTDTKWWHKWIWDEEQHAPRRGVEVRLIKGRLKFGDAKAGAPFPSAIIVFRGIEQ